MKLFRVLVVGTGTEIGKTHVTTCLLSHARAQGRRVRAYKPIATGIEGLCEDAERHAAALDSPYLHPTFAFRRPVSPHLAAREEVRVIDLDTIRQRADDMGRDADAVIIEGAGGLFTPLSETITNVALVHCLLPAVVVLVAPDRLGVLHDIGACSAAARASGIEISAVVLSAPSASDASTGSNALELARMGHGPIAGVFPRAKFDALSSQEVAAQVWKAIEATTQRGL